MSKTLIALLLAFLMGDASAQAMRTMGGAGFLHADEARFLPGLYHFDRGCARYAKGHVGEAMAEWQLAAGWAVKEAQYNLGLAWFTGERVQRDRPLGLAWLALAAERKDAAFSGSLAAAWDAATPAERQQANALYAPLLDRYGDARTRRKAMAHFERELAQLTGSRVGMAGHVSVWTPAGGRQDIAVYRRALQEKARLNFGRAPDARVRVGDIERASR
jgi:TPR repeat protein